MRYTSSSGNALMAVAAAAVLSLPLVSTVAAVELAQDCTNADAGYMVAFPSGWYANELVEGGDIDDVAACRFFGPEAFEVRPGSGIGGVAIAVTTEADDPPEGGTPITVDGRPARVVESITVADGFDPAGTRSYQYWIENGDAWLVLTTSDGPTWVGDHADNRATLDAMAGSLRFSASSLPDTAIADGRSGKSAPAAAWMAVILLALGTGVRAARRG